MTCMVCGKTNSKEADMNNDTKDIKPDNKSLICPRCGKKTIRTRIKDKVHICIACGHDWRE